MNRSVRRPRRNNQSAKQIASRALSVAQSVKSARERKYEITVFEDTPSTTSGSVVFLNEIDQDIGDVGARTGDSVVCVRARMFLQLKLPATINGSHAIRVVMVHDKQNKMSSAANLFIGTGTNHAPMLQYTKDYRLSFGVIWDSMPIELSTYHPTQMIKFDVPMQIRTRYLQGTSSIVTGALKLVFITDLNTTAAAQPTITGTVRIDYTDS